MGVCFKFDRMQRPSTSTKNIQRRCKKTKNIFIQHYRGGKNPELSLVRERLLKKKELLRRARAAPIDYSHPG